MNNVDQIEEYVLAQLEQAQPDTGSVLVKLAELAQAGQSDTAISLAEIAENTLRDRGLIDDALRVLRLHADWVPGADFRVPCTAIVKKILGNTPESRAMIKNCGLDKRVLVTECLDRLELLRALAPGVLCVDKTWGFGVVTAVDPFTEKVTIDFERKPNHELSMSYAAETLELLDEKHILAIRHRDPAALEAMVESDPAQVVRMAVGSYGPLNPVILQEKLVPGIVAADAWKKFWDAARKELKRDPGAVVPTKRTEPILLKEAADAYDENWFRQLKHDRDIESILAKIGDWHTLHASSTIDPVHRPIIEDRLKFVIRGADLMGKTVMPRAMMVAHSVMGADETVGVAAYVDELLVSDKLLPLLDALSAKDMKSFVAFLLRIEREKTLAALLRLLPRLDVTSLTEVLQVLIREGAEDPCRDAIRALMNARRVEVELLSWLSRNQDKLQEWELCAPSEFAEIMLLEMEKDYTGNRLKAQNQLRDRFTQKTWVRNLFDALGNEGRDRFFLRLKDSSAWPTMEKRSVLGHIIKLYPELEKWMTAKSGDKAPPKARGPVTSIRAFRERQLLAERIQKVDIPNNSKEIAVARAHGDLRENFEYQAAKDAQGLLMRRQAELQQMLAEVVPTEFEAPPTDAAGIGCGVRIQYRDGRMEEYYLLGVWDRDEALGIISSESKMAQALEGHKAGETVTIPTEHGETEVKLLEIIPLSPAVRQWIVDVPETLDESRVSA